MRLVGQLAEIRDLARLPKQPHPRSALRQLADGGLARQRRQGLEVGSVVAPDKAGRRGRLQQRFQQRVDMAEVELAVAPAKMRERIEAVVLHRRGELVGERRAIRRGAERAIPHPAAGPPGDLRDLGRGQPTRPVAVELAEAGEGHMVDIHVQTHADRIRRDQKVDLLLLIQRHLGVAGAWREPSHHHRAPAPAAADQLGDRVDFPGGERDHGAARRQLGKLRRADIGELRQSRPGLDLYVPDQAMQQGPDRFRAQEHGLHHPARVEQPVGEHVPAVGVGAQLNLVHRHELGVPVERHRFHGAGEPPRVGRHDFLLPGQERDVARALAGHHPVVVLAREQAQREANDPGRMG